MTIVRQIGALVLAVAGVAIWFLMAPAEVAAPDVQTREPVADRSSDITDALLNYEANEALTQGAPQQSVVNGWVAKDLLTIIAEQQNEALTRDEVPPPVQPIVPNDERIPAFAGLLLMGLVLALVTSPRAASAASPVQHSMIDEPLAV
jgi:hypothetical protein